MEFRGRSSLGSLMLKLALMCCVCLCCLTIPNPWISGNFNRRSSTIGIRNWMMKSISEYELPQQPEALAPEAGQREWILRRRLAGSSKPQCTSKVCDQCSPCLPVLVPIPPGTSFITQPYPEAWRCKCGNRLYIP